MRIKTWYPAKANETRKHTFFAWWPIQIGNDLRWWERVTVLYRSELRYWMGGGRFAVYWEPVEFIDYVELTERTQEEP